MVTQLQGNIGHVSISCFFQPQILQSMLYKKNKYKQKLF